LAGGIFEEFLREKTQQPDYASIGLSDMGMLRIYFNFKFILMLMGEKNYPGL
jgi:hypothetical protein